MATAVRTPTRNNPAKPPDTARIYAYLRVSTEEQLESGAGLDAQRHALEIEAGRRGWDLVRIFEDAASGKSVISASSPMLQIMMATSTSIRVIPGRRFMALSPGL